MSEAMKIAGFPEMAVVVSPLIYQMVIVRSGVGGFEPFHGTDEESQAINDENSVTRCDQEAMILAAQYGWSLVNPHHPLFDWATTRPRLDNINQFREDAAIHGVPE